MSSNIDSSNFYNVFNKFLEIYSGRNPQSKIKKYIYINLWNIGCLNCIDEIPLLNSYAVNWNKVSCVFISPHTENAAFTFLKRENIEANNFTFINGLNSFIFHLYSKIEVKEQIFPIHFILNIEGEVIAYLVGAIKTPDYMNRLMKFIENLK